MCFDKNVSGIRKFEGTLGKTKLNRFAHCRTSQRPNMPLCLVNFQKMGYGLFFRVICFHSSSIPFSGALFFRAVREMSALMILALYSLVPGNQPLLLFPMWANLGEKEAKGSHLSGFPH